MSKEHNLPVSTEDIIEIIEILETTPYDNLQLETEHFTLTLKSNNNGIWGQEMQTLDEPELIQDSEQEKSKHSEVDPHTQTLEAGLLEVPSPMVGTFYRSPKPGADPFIEPGMQVQPDTVIAIVEVMKLMSTIRAGIEGTVVEIYRRDGEFVETGQALISVRPPP
jgi:acetyl-CoA carboxylase biotin carboxyl carrier protein